MLLHLITTSVYYTVWLSIHLMFIHHLRMLHRNILFTAYYEMLNTMQKKYVLAQVWRVVDFCCQYLEKEVSEDNYLYLQELALLYSLERLDAFIDYFILTRFATLSFTPDFLRDIPLHKLTSYLSNGQVNAHRFFCMLRLKVYSWKQQLTKQFHCDMGSTSCLGKRALMWLR